MYKQVLEDLVNDTRTDIGLDMVKKKLTIEHKIDMKLIAKKEELSRLKKDKRLEDRVRKIEDDTAEMQMDIKVTSVRVLIVATSTLSFSNIICMKTGIATGTTGNHADAAARAEYGSSIYNYTSTCAGIYAYAWTCWEAIYAHIFT